MVGSVVLKAPLYFKPRMALVTAVGTLYLFLVSGALLPRLLAADGAGSVDLETGLLWLQVALGAVIVLASLVFWFHYWLRGVSRLLRAAWLPLLLALLSLASSAWSVDPGLTLRRSLALAGAIVVALLMVGVLGYRRTVLLVTTVLISLIVTSVVVSLVWPDFGIHQSGSHVGRWRGLYFHKNLLGREAALAAVLLVATFPWRGRRSRLWVLLFLMICVVALVMANSVTGVVAAVGAVAAVLAYRATHLGRRVAAVVAQLAATLVVAAGLLVTVFPEVLLGMVNRDLSFTGRTQLWREVWQRIQERPWFGHGYRAFWGDDGGQRISGELGWRVTHAHNGWLDTGLDLGMAGLAAIFLLLAIPLIRALLARRARLGLDTVTIGVAAVTFLISLSDSVLLGPNNLFVTLLVIQFLADGLVAVTEPRRVTQVTPARGVSFGTRGR